MLSQVYNTLGRTQNQNADLQNIRGKVTLITGGATESGIMIAQLLARRGARVCFTAGSPKELNAAQAALGTREDIIGIVAELSGPESIKQLFDEVEHRLGSIEILVNNTPGLQNQADREIVRTLCLQEAITRMQSKGEGRIVNINDPAVRYKNWGAPAASNMARTHSLAAALRRQASELGIRVTSIEQEAQVVGAEDLAYCVFESLVQSYRIDVVYLAEQTPM